MRMTVTNAGRAMAAVLALAAGGLPARAQVDPAEEARNLVRALVLAPGAPGRETQVRAAVRRLAPTWASFREDNLGNLTVSVGDGAPTLLMVAHMDEPGYVVTGITPRGYLKLQRLGRAASSLYDQFHVGQPLLIQGRRRTLPAVAAVHSTHLWRGNASPLDHPALDEDLFVDLGARDPAEVEAAGVALLDPVLIARRVVDLAEGKIAGPAMDDRAGCAALLMLLNTLEPAKIHGTLTVAFSAQALVGGRGAARLAGRFPDADVLVVDAPAPATGGPSVPGAGPVLAVPGGADGFSADLYSVVTEKAARARIKVQTAPFTRNGDASGFPTPRRVLALGAAVGWPGTMAETVDGNDVASLAALLKSVAEAERP